MGYKGMCVCICVKVLVTHSACLDDCRIFRDVLMRDVWTRDKHLEMVDMYAGHFRIQGCKGVEGI